MTHSDHLGEIEATVPPFTRGGFSYPRERPTWDQTWLSVAQTMANRAVCTRRRVGAVVVSADNLRIWIGYNGTPPKMPHCTSDSGTSGCPRGAHHADRPLHLPHSDDPRNDLFCTAVHAEVNAIRKASVDPSRRAGDCTIYITTAPCRDCTDAILNSGFITNIVWPGHRSVVDAPPL